MAIVRRRPTSRMKVDVLVLRGPLVSRAITINSYLIERAAYLSFFSVTAISAAPLAVLEVV